MRGVLVGAAPRAARNRNTAKCGVKRLRGARGAPPTSEGKSTYFIAGAIVEEFDLAYWGNTEPGIRRAAESVLGGFVPSRQHRFADFQLQGTLSGNAGRVEA